ncbi:putative metabotropic glutamate receptor 2 [Ixodes scapularis]
MGKPTGRTPRERRRQSATTRQRRSRKRCTTTAVAKIQITTLCVSISLSAYVALFCLFSPKIYIILCHPDKNVRKLTMNSATYKKAPTSSTCGTSVNHGTCGTGSSGEQLKLTLAHRSVAQAVTDVSEDKDSLASL